MKKNINFNFLFLCLFTMFMVSCEDDQNAFLDLNNLDDSLASFAIDNVLVYNPAENVDNQISVGVNTQSSVDRSFVVSLDEEDSTLDDSFYTIGSFTGVIPAGSFFGSITVTTLGGENPNLPGATDELVFNLESLEGATIESSNLQDEIGVSVECPSVDLSALPGTYAVTALSFGGSFPGESSLPRTVVAGPGENQITVVEGAYPNFGGEELIATINPDTGAIIAVEPNVMTTGFGGNNYALRSGGIVLTCAGIINFNLDFDGPVAGNPVTFNLVKQ